MTPRTRSESVRQKILDRSTVAYVRISADRREDAAGVERQEKAIKLLAKAKGQPITHVYNDNDKTATDLSKPRPDFERMLSAIEAGEIGTVIVWHFDRLIRDMSDLMRLIKVGGPIGLTIASVHGIGLDLSDPTGIAVAQILTAIAQMEVKHKSMRQQAANEQRAEKGMPGTLRAFGYNSDGTIREEEAALVKEIFTRFANGAPITELTKFLDASGLRGATANKKAPDARWSRSGVRRMLTNRRYIGELWYRQEFVRMGTWQPLIDPDLFAACGARLSDPTRTTTTSPNKRWIGAGRYRCGECEREGVEQTVVSFGSTSRNKARVAKRYRYYKCANNFHLMRPMEPVDRYLKDAVSAWLNSPKLRSAVSIDRNVAEVTRLRDEATALRGKEDAYALQIESGEITPKQNKLLMARLTDRLAQIEDTLAELGKTSALAAIAGAADPGRRWREELDIWQQGEVLDAVCEVTLFRAPPSKLLDPVDPAYLRIDWKH